MADYSLLNPATNPSTDRVNHSEKQDGNKQIPKIPQNIADVSNELTLHGREPSSQPYVSMIRSPRNASIEIPADVKKGLHTLQQSTDKQQLTFSN